MRGVWVAMLAVELATSGCSFTMRSPHGAKHQGECDTSRRPPITDAVIAGSLGAIGLAIVSDDCHQLGGCTSGRIGGVMIIAAIVYAIASIKGFSNRSLCRDLPPAPS